MVAVEETYSADLGRTSSTLMLVAVSGPSLVTVMVKEIWSPRKGLLVLTVFVTARSARSSVMVTVVFVSPNRPATALESRRLKYCSPSLTALSTMGTENTRSPLVPANQVRVPLVAI